jgi:hypothetical protein
MVDKLTWTLSRGVICDRTRVFVLAYSKREPGTRVFRWTGKWDNYYVPCIAGGICFVAEPLPEILTMCLEGTIHSFSPQGLKEDHVDRSEQGPIHRGVLRNIRNIGGEAYVMGAGRQVYRRQSFGVWTRFDQGMVTPLGNADLVAIESMAGFNKDEIYAVGWGGEIWLCERRLWAQQQSPTNVRLTSVVCAPDGFVYVSGQLGILIRGRRDAWEVIAHNSTEDTIQDMVWFDGKIWATTSKDLFVLDGDDFVPATVRPKGASRYQYLDANDGVLWSFGETQLAFYDGSSWQEVAGP